MSVLNELRNSLLQTVEDVRNKKIDATDAIAISKNAQTIINLTRLELDYFMLSKTDDKSIPFLESATDDK